MTSARNSIAGIAPIQYQCAARIPYWYEDPAQPINSSAPRFAERKLRPATHAVISRPAMKKSSPVLARPFKPLPRMAKLQRRLLPKLQLHKLHLLPPRRSQPALHKHPLEFDARAEIEHRRRRGERFLPEL